VQAGPSMARLATYEAPAYQCGVSAASTHAQHEKHPPKPDPITKTIIHSPLLWTTDS